MSFDKIMKSLMIYEKKYTTRHHSFRYSISRWPRYNQDFMMISMSGQSFRG